LPFNFADLGNFGTSGNIPSIRAYPRESAVNLVFPITAITRDDGDPGDLFLIRVISVYQW